MTAYTNFIANIDKVGYSTVLPIDNIIGTYEGTTASSAPGVGSVTTTTEDFDTGFGEDCYFAGRFSVNGGTTWNDFDSMTPDFTTPTMPVFETQNAFAQVRGGGTLRIITQNYYNNVAGTGSAKTFLWQAVLYAKNDQGSIQPNSIATNTFFTSQERKYQQIAVQGTIPFNISAVAGNSVSVSNPVGETATVVAFYRELTPTSRITTLFPFKFIEVRITDSTITFYQEDALAVILGTTTTGYVDYRIYYND